MITALLLSLICRLFCFLATKGHHKLLKDRARKTLKYLHLSQDSESCKKTAKAIFIIDGNDPFISRYKFGEGIEEGGLSRSGPAADKNVVAGADNAVQKSSDLFRQGAQSQKILHPDRLLRKTPDRHDRTVQSHRRQNDIHTVSICKARIHDRRGFVDHAVTGGNYLLYYVLQLLL